jgi:Na+(H+)/acetate symporter ActP
VNAGAAAMAATAAITVVLAAWSARRARTTGDFYVAARAVPPWWNASAISGEYLSAASFLGVAGLIMVGGADAIWFPVGYAVGYVLLLALVSAPLRRSGAYTLPDFCEARLRSGLVRTAASVLVVTIGWLYVVPQLQGAGLALRTILGTPAWVGGVAVALTVLSVIISGGMRSVTFAQAFQYWLKLVAIAVPILVLLAVWRLDGSPSAIAPAPPAFAETTTVVFDRAVEVQVAEPLPVVAGGEPALLPAGRQALGPGPVEFPAGAPVPHIVGTTALPGQVWGQPLQANDHALYRTYALMVALFLGTMGLPHILVRFYTNPDGRQARRTALIVIGLVGAFYLAPATYGMLGRLYAPQLLMTGQADAVVLLLPRAMLDGAPGVWLSALVAAGAAAAFLATATGLTVTVAGVLSQDVVSRRVADPIVAFRLAAAVAVLSPLALSLVAGRLPLAQSVALAFAVAASTFCPLLLLGIWWRGLTDAGAAAGLGVGGLLSLAAIAVSAAAPGLTGWPAALLAQPAAWTMPAAFAVMVGVSLATKHRVLPDVHRIMVRLHTPEGTGVRQSWSARGTRGL